MLSNILWTGCIGDGWYRNTPHGHFLKQRHTVPAVPLCSGTAFFFFQQNYWVMAAELQGSEGEVVQQLCEEHRLEQMLQSCSDQVP